ncbi:hypothetical protein KFL_000560190 [Klebsormidium nitens]|uniref:Uncharacterized protein n=1 Tax=Klebsormidium nitens TaxID=105231 RepID=A0A1Y1HTM2_KLENI|nr:hypothetical protein KFL_000560190 [Klebsormidium nitens]|eukprot:GAQ80529.1 hypothetical protein KFL_000560190 [Klebsormidium nitens]
MEDDGAALVAAWQMVDRSTLVGRALFALYNGDLSGKKAGNKYSDRNRVSIEKRAAAIADGRLTPGLSGKENEAAAPIAKKPVVRVPKVGVKKQVAPKVLPPPGRKQAETIKLEQELDRAANPIVLPRPKGPLLDDAEKLRLQRMFEFNGKLSEDTLDAPAPVRPPPPRRGSVEEKEALFQEIMDEIQEREAFLRDMAELGRGKEFEGKIRIEIKERLAQLKKLDEHIHSDHGVIVRRNSLRIN